MKRIFCLITTLCIILGSFSFCFASPTSWDTSDQSNLRGIYNSVTSGGSLYSLINTISSRLNTISNTLIDIKSYLIDDGHGVAYWTSAISTWMSPIYNSITNIPVDISTIIGALGYFDTNNTYHPYLIGIDELSESLANHYLKTNTLNRTYILKNSHLQLVNYDTGLYDIANINSQYGPITTTQYNWLNGSPLGNIALIMKYINNNIAYAYRYQFLTGYQNFNASQSFTKWDDLNTSSFTPTSATNGIYTWLSKIQNPVARLSYVLASDERIEAQEAAAANEEAVVDNFIDSSGAGSASTSNIGSISDLSSGYKSNFGSDASVSGIFNIFNSNNMGWFSQETANQLDTTAPSRRGSSFNTPLLDQQIIDIYDQIGVKND